MLHPLFIQTWQTTPIVTKWMSVVVLLLSFLVQLDICSEFSLSFSTFFIKKFQIWRIVTPFCYFGKFNMEILLHIIFFLRYSKMLEEGFLHTSDYLFLILYNMTAILIIAIFLKFSILSNILSSAITYIWTRKNRSTQVQLMGCIIFPAFYLPFVVPCFSLFAEHRLPFDEVLGLIVGQSYYYLKYVVRRYNLEILRTPLILKRLCQEEISEKTSKDGILSFFRFGTTQNSLIRNNSTSNPVERLIAESNEYLSDRTDSLTSPDSTDDDLYDSSSEGYATNIRSLTAVMSQGSTTEDDCDVSTDGSEYLSRMENFSELEEFFEMERSVQSEESLQDDISDDESIKLEEVQSERLNEKDISGDESIKLNDSQIVAKSTSKKISYDQVSNPFQAENKNKEMRSAGQEGPSSIMDNFNSSMVSAQEMDDQRLISGVETQCPILSRTFTGSEVGKKRDKGPNKDIKTDIHEKTKSALTSTGCEVAQDLSSVEKSDAPQDNWQEWSDEHTDNEIYEQIE